MDLIAPLKAQTLRFGVPHTETGAIFLPDVVSRLKEVFRFVEVPSKLSEYNLDAGVIMQYGTWNNVSFSMLKIYNNGMLIDGVSTTDALDSVLDEVESIMLSDFNTRIVSSRPVARLYTSQMEVRVSAEVVEALEVFVGLRARLREMVRAYGVDTADYIVNGFGLASDHALSATPAKPGRFLFERRADRKFEENIFFAEAPLQTAEHLALLNEMEVELTSG